MVQSNHTISKHNSTKLVFIEYGEGTITINNDSPRAIDAGDTFFIEPGEEYIWKGNMRLIIVYIPHWSAEQHIIHKD
jgi:mannose-6-phosphate isomerase-like protein (cupin superfamily)